MLKIGLTGGIGSGKSTVSAIFRLLDIPVYVADIEAKRIMNTDETVREQLIAAFGEKVYNLKNVINRKFLSSIIFNDLDALEQINAIVHPVVRHDFSEWCTQQIAPYVIQESAILFETGLSQIFDKTITVTAQEELRIKRVILRDGVTEQQVIARIKNQLKESEKCSKSDFVIHNSNELLIPQILNVHHKILSQISG